jgi:hypothetical protein
MSALETRLAREAKDAASVSTGAGPRPPGSTGAAKAWDRKHRQAIKELETIRRMQAAPARARRPPPSSEPQRRARAARPPSLPPTARRP